MFFLGVLCGMLFLQSIECKNPKCENYFTLYNLQLITDYANWKNIRYIVILEDGIKLGCNLKFLKKNMYNFFVNNKYLTMHSSINVTQQFMQDLKYKICLITFYRRQLKDEFVKQANKLTFYGEKLAWLIIVLSGEDIILEYLRLANLGLDADVTIAVDTTWIWRDADHQVANDAASEEFNDTKVESGNSDSENESSEEVNIFTPFINNASSYEMTNFCQKNEINPKTYCMLQIYKIRKYCNSSLVVYSLGSWTLENGTMAMKPFLNVEKRNNFFQFPLVIGEKNSSDPLVSENVIEDDDDENDIQEFSRYFCSLLNASKNIITFSKLGNKNSDGVWTDLFGAIMNEEIDIGLDSIIKTPDRYADMVFTYNIMESKRNIYIQPQESNELRDIFSVPFEARLMQCVFGTCGIFAIVMTVYKKIIAKCKVEQKNADCQLLDSVMWSIGIFSQQGSIWKPTGSAAEQIIIIVSLAFTLLIYNSYSAFITSVLSIKLTNIRTVDDLLKSDYEIGYAKNSQDEIYLRSMNITQLNEIYLRGYLHNNINNITDGLLKAARGNYGFFASSHVARRELLVINNYKCKYDITEIPINDTVNYIAFPMSKHSSFRKLINLSIIKMYETGVYKHLYPLLYPSLQKCNKPITYQSARLPDLMTAFAVLALGIIFSLIFIIAEFLWMRKRSLYLVLRKSVLHPKPIHSNRHLSKGHHHFLK